MYCLFPFIIPAKFRENTVSSSELLQEVSFDCSKIKTRQCQSQEMWQGLLELL